MAFQSQTFVGGNVLTASQMNLLQESLNETRKNHKSNSPPAEILEGIFFLNDTSNPKWLLTLVGSGNSLINLINIDNLTGVALPKNHGALYSKTETQSVPNTSQHQLQWLAAGQQYDTRSFFNSSSPGILSVGAITGTYRARVMAGMRFTDSASGVRKAELRRNGAIIAGGPRVQTVAEDENTNIAFSSAPVTVNSGDFFDIVVSQNTASSQNIQSGATTWISIELVSVEG